jgi:hypothetical protein
MARARASERARAAGDIFACNSLNFLAIADQPFLSQHCNVLVVESVRQRHEFLVPAIVPCLVPADQQDRRSTRIERIEHAERMAAMLHAQLAHVRVLRARDARAVRMSELRSALLEEPHVGPDRFLLSFRQPVPPLAELVRVLDFPMRQGL